MSCSKEAPLLENKLEEVIETRIEIDELNVLMIEVPRGLTNKAAFEWAKNQSIENYTEASGRVAFFQFCNDLGVSRIGFPL